MISIHITAVTWKAKIHSHAIIQTSGEVTIQEHMTGSSVTYSDQSFTTCVVCCCVIFYNALCSENIWIVFSNVARYIILVNLAIRDPELVQLCSHHVFQNASLHEIRFLLVFCMISVKLAILQVGKGKWQARCKFCFAASSSNLVSSGSGRLSTDFPANTAQHIKPFNIFTKVIKHQQCCAVQYKVPKKEKEEPTIEFHCDLALFLVVHDGIGIVVCIPNHYLNILLRARSWYKENREQST